MLELSITCSPNRQTFAGDGTGSNDPDEREDCTLVYNLSTQDRSVFAPIMQDLFAGWGDG